MYARVSKMMVQFLPKIEKLSHIMGPTPILEMARAYGLHPRLWLLFKAMKVLLVFFFVISRTILFLKVTTITFSGNVWFLALLQNSWKLFRFFWVSMRGSNFWEKVLSLRKVSQLAPLVYISRRNNSNKRNSFQVWNSNTYQLFDIFCSLTFEQIGTEIHWTFHKSAACLIETLWYENFINGSLCVEPEIDLKRRT